MTHNFGNQDSREEFLSIGEFFAFVERWRTTIIGTTLLVVTLATAYTLTRTPVYRASATLRLEQEGSGEGALADLAALTSAPAAESEIALLGSRSLAEEVVAPSPTWTTGDEIFRATPSDRLDMLEARYLDLATVVQPDDLSPLASLQRRLGGEASAAHRLFVSFGTVADQPVEELHVTFVDEHRVRLSRPGFMGWSEGDEREFDYIPDQPIEYGGSSIRLHGVGAFAGQSYRVWRASQRDAVEGLMARTRVRETARNSGVLYLTVDDGDPNRAAESANALAQNYFMRSMRLGSLRAERTLGFVEAELERVLEQLDEAEKEVVEQSAKHTRAINISATSQVMIDALADYEAEKAQLGLSQTSLNEARRQIDDGDLRGLALLGPSLPDPMTISHIQAIGELRAASANIDRSDAGSYKLLLQRDLVELHTVRDRLALRARLLEQSIEEYVGGNSDSFTQLAGQESSPDPIALSYLNEIASLDGQLALLDELVTEKHFDHAANSAARSALVARLVVHAKTRLAGLKGNIAEHDALIKSHTEAVLTWSSDERGRIDDAAASLVVLVRENLTSQLAGIEARRASLDEAIEDIEQELASLPEHERRLADPMRRREAFDRIAKMLLESQQQAQLARAATMPSAILIDPAVPPVNRTSPHILTNIGLAILLGLMLGMALAWLRNALLDSLHTQASVEEATGLSVIGTVPDYRHGPLKARCAGKNFVPMRDDLHGPVAECYRSIREALRFSLASGKRVQTFASTSCVANEGKTITNIDMALAFAGGGRKVLFVDADMRKPSLGEYFELCEGEGFAEALEGRVSWQGSVLPSGIEGLDLLPAGRPMGSPNDLLRTAGAKHLLEEFKGVYDHVVFDLPPAMIVSDVETFADEFDAVALVYRSGGVSRGMLIRTVQRLRQSGVDLAGVVLNFVRHSSAGGYGYYGEGYGYGADRMEEQEKRSG